MPLFFLRLRVDEGAGDQGVGCGQLDDEPAGAGAGADADLSCAGAGGQDRVGSRGCEGQWSVCVRACAQHGERGRQGEYDGQGGGLGPCRTVGEAAWHPVQVAAGCVGEGGGHRHGRDLDEEELAVCRAEDVVERDEQQRGDEAGRDDRLGSCRPEPIRFQRQVFHPPAQPSAPDQPRQNKHGRSREARAPTGAGPPSDDGEERRSTAPQPESASARRPASSVRRPHCGAGCVPLGAACVRLPRVLFLTGPAGNGTVDTATALRGRGHDDGARGGRDRRAWPTRRIRRHSRPMPPRS